MSDGNPKQTQEHLVDVKYVADDGTTRLMRDVIAERKSEARQYTKAQLGEARKLRCRAIALLETCLCCYPMARFDTASQHAPWCPAEHMYQSFEKLDGKAT